MAGGQSIQNNKTHKPGRRAGAGARARNRHGKLDVRNSSSLASHLARKGKESRMQSAAHSRNQSRQAALQRMRHEHAPLVVQIVSLADNVDEQFLWDLLRNACDVGSDARSLKDFEQEQAQAASDMKADLPSHARSPVTLRLPEKHKMRVTLLPPLTCEARQDIHALVDVSKAADVVLLCVRNLEGSGKHNTQVEASIDKQGALALQVLRSMGLPEVMVAVQGAGSSLKERAAAKKQATAALQCELPGDRKYQQVQVAPLDTVADCVTLLRHLVSLNIEPPMWRRARPHLLIEGSVFFKATPEATTGTLLLDTYVRHVGLSANQIVAVPGGGDFSIDKIWAAPEHVPQQEKRQAGMALLDEQHDLELLAQADEDKEPLLRENPRAAEAMDMEQTWPTQEEMQGNKQHRRLAPGTSDYQACWILDDDEDAAGDLDDEEDGDAPAAPGGDAGMVPSLVKTDGSALDEGTELLDTDMAEEGEDEEFDAVQAFAEEQQLRAERRQQAVDDDANFPDEIETPHDVPARDRFKKFRGLKSFRTSDWDPKEDLPQEYAKVFAFENFIRARKLAAVATEKAQTGVEPGIVMAGTYIRMSLTDVPEDAAAAVCDRVSAYLLGKAPPLVALALHKHECKLSIVNMTVKKHAGYKEPVANKEALTIVTGVRTFSARPVLSTNEYNMDKFKLEKYMHDGKTYVISVYAPIAYPPLPVLVVKKIEGHVPQLVATGTVDGPNPDRIVLKRIVLTGYPVKIQKKKAVVKYMFFSPEDVKWFRPLDVWTKYGKRGRIKESLGTHGAMKCVFDAPVQQHDSVCIALYKRVFPKWPQDLRFHDSF